jgi:hypothetical protein
MCCNFGEWRLVAWREVKNAIQPAIFKWRQTAPELIACAVRWYLRYSLSLRDVEELLSERGLEADDLALRPTRRARTGKAAAPSSQADQQILACR